MRKVAAPMEMRPAF